MNNIKTWDSRWENEFIKVDSFEEYYNSMGFIVKDYLRELEKLIKKINVKQGNVLDIGGGYGPVLNFLVDDSNRKYLFDISERGLEIAKKFYFLENVHNLNVLTDDVSVFKNKFNLILLTEVLEHIPHDNHSLLFNVLHDLLVPGGELIITSPNVASLTSIFRVIRGLQPMIFHLDNNHVSAHSVNTLQKLVSNNSGFRIIDSYTTTIRFFPGNFRLPFRLNRGEHLVFRIIKIK